MMIKTAIFIVCCVVSSVFSDKNYHYGFDIQFISKQSYNNKGSITVSGLKTTGRIEQQQEVGKDKITFNVGSEFKIDGLQMVLTGVFIEEKLPLRDTGDNIAVFSTSKKWYNRNHEGTTKTVRDFTVSEFAKTIAAGK